MENTSRSVIELYLCSKIYMEFEIHIDFEDKKYLTYFHLLCYYSYCIYPMLLELLKKGGILIPETTHTFTITNVLYLYLPEE